VGVAGLAGLLGDSVMAAIDLLPGELIEEIRRVA